MVGTFLFKFKDGAAAAGRGFVGVWAGNHDRWVDVGGYVPVISRINVEKSRACNIRITTKFLG
jgi:hypothetical protein